MGFRLCELGGVHSSCFMHVSRGDEALHFDALAQQSCCAHGTMTRPAKGIGRKHRRFTCARSAQPGNRIDSATIDVAASCLMASTGVFLAV